MTFKPFPEISYECVDEETGEIVIRTNREEELIRVRTYRSEDEIARLVDCWNACRKIAFPDAHLKATDEYTERLEALRVEAWARAEQLEAALSKVKRIEAAQ